MSKEAVDKLHPHEKKVLLALKKLQEGLTGEIAKETGLPESTVHKAGQWAKLRGLVKTKETTEEKAELTPQGRRYAEEGMPEKRLLTLVSQGKSTTDEIAKAMPEPEIALAWAKRKGWIELYGKKIVITNIGKNALTMMDTPAEKFDITRKEIPELRKRRLIRLTKIKKKKIYLTKKGRDLIPRIKEDRSVGQLRPHHIKTGAWKERGLRPYDVKLPAPVHSPARLHPYTQFINDTRRKLIAMGFREMKGPWAELEFWNMDALYMPQDHPARGIHDVFRLKNPSRGEVRNKKALQNVARTHKDGWVTGSSGWGQWDPEKTLNLVLRSQTTCVSARTLASGVDTPSMYFTLSRVFRPDVLDATHSLEFDQLEGIVVGENLNLRHLMGYLDLFGREVAGAEKIRFRPGYFPFTEPSLEMDGYVNGKWYELVGSGIFRPEVTKPLGIEEPVLAWGMGFNRLAMMKMGITDIRDLFSHDLEWLRGRKLLV